jgi:hypothetical protein
MVEKLWKVIRMEGIKAFNAETQRARRKTGGRAQVCRVKSGGAWRPDD